jgi:C_GCAxxG_C_C family probable redox protein
MGKANDALACFGQGFNCSQAVLSVFAEDFGLEREMALRVAGGFGGGMRMGEVCGAVTGAFMVIGLKYGKMRPEDDEARKQTYRIVREFADKMKAKHGSILCRELIGCDLSTKDGYTQAIEKGVFVTLCPGFVKDAVEILEAIL